MVPKLGSLTGEITGRATQSHETCNGSDQTNKSDKQKTKGEVQVKQQQLPEADI